MISEKKRSAVRRYGVALLATAGATLLTLALRSVLDRSLIAPFFAAVMVSAWYGGPGPGGVATLLSVLSTDYFLIHPTYAFSINHLDDLVELAVFSMVAFLINFLNDAQKRAHRELLESRERLRLIVDGALDAVVSTDTGGRITDWNPQAEKIFSWPRQEAVGRSLTETVVLKPNGHPDGLSTLLSAGDGTALNRRLETTGLRRDGTEFPVEVSVVPIGTPDAAGFSAFLRDITDRKRHENELRKLNESLEERVRERTAWLTLLYDVTRAANDAETVGQAFRFAVRRICDDGFWRFSHLYLLDYADALVSSPIFHGGDSAAFLDLRQSTCDLRLERGRGLAGRVFERGKAEFSRDLPADFGDAVLKSGVRSAVAFPVTVGQEIVAVVECFSDRDVAGAEHILPLLTSVGIELSRVVERRRLQEDYAEAVWHQQRKIAHELHDGLGQELTGVGFMARSLAEKTRDLESGPLAEKVTEGIGRALEQIRTIAKGVLPVDVDVQGLMTSLAQLAAGVEPVYGIPCRFDCPSPVLMGDAQSAQHLYRIAQEAVTNAVRHARARSVAITLETLEEGMRLRVVDDGIGIPMPGGMEQGSGLRIMKYRAAAIGATLNVERIPDGGTAVVCTLSRGDRGIRI